MENILEKLRQFDAYPKTLEDVRIKTYGGATISVVSFVIMGLLFCAELSNYLTMDIAEELFVDTSRSPKIQINIDIVLPSISCDFITLDAMDSSGEEHLQIDHSIYKRRLDSAGNFLADPIKEDILANRRNESKDANEKTECGSCYGAAVDPKRCCNTCEEVREAYRERRWALDNLDNITQCKEEKFSEKLKLAFSQGCQIYGHLIVNRVSGSFHVAPGKSFSVNHVHVHDVQPFSSSAFNTSHEIKHLSFGTDINTTLHDPLKNTFGCTEEGATMFQYYIKIVPTSYVKKDGSIINTNQFSVTKHQKAISIMSGESGMPGVFFQYELSPLMVKYIEKERSFGHFATNVCAIIGGVYTVAGLLDTLLYHSFQLIKRKIEIGKSRVTK